MTTPRGNVAARSIADALLALAVFLLPWWAVLLFAVVLFFVFERFVELFLAAFLLDLLYGVPFPRLGGFEFVLSLLSVLLYVILYFLKRRMRF